VNEGLENLQVTISVMLWARESPWRSGLVVVTGGKILKWIDSQTSLLPSARSPLEGIRDDWLELLTEAQLSLLVLDGTTHVCVRFIPRTYVLDW